MLEINLICSAPGWEDIAPYAGNGIDRKTMRYIKENDYFFSGKFDPEIYRIIEDFDVINIVKTMDNNEDLKRYKTLVLLGEERTRDGFVNYFKDLEKFGLGMFGVSPEGVVTRVDEDLKEIIRKMVGNGGSEAIRRLFLTDDSYQHLDNRNKGSTEVVSATEESNPAIHPYISPLQ